MKKTKEILKATAVLAVICLVISAALAGTNRLTDKKIALLKEQQETESMARICKAEVYREKTLTFDGSTQTYFVAEKDDKPVGYIFTTTQSGYGGAISVMTGIDPEGKILAVEILDVSNETVGLGQNAAKPEFTKQFEGKSGTIEVSKSANGTQIQALTGATITSAAVTETVNTALALFQQVKGA